MRINILFFHNRCYITSLSHRGEVAEFGLRRRSRKPLYVHAYQGFKSPPLRQFLRRTTMPRFILQSLTLLTEAEE